MTDDISFVPQRTRRKARPGAFGMVVVAVAASLAVAAPPLAPDRAPERKGLRRESDTGLLRAEVRDPTVRAAEHAVRWPGLDRNSLAAEDRRRDATPGLPYRVGVDRAIPGGRVISPRNDGTWHTMPDGSRAWSLQLEVPEAQAVRVHFKRCLLADGTQLVVTGGEEFLPDVLRGEGRGGRNGFWSTAILGEVAYLEYQDATGKAPPPVILIDRISHIYRGFGEQEGADGAVAGTSCLEDVMCFDTNLGARNSVGRMLFNDPPKSGAFLCTGALMVDADADTSAGYFLTANHCIGTQESAESLTVYWFYQTSSCNGQVPSLSRLPRSDGATLIATSGDYLLGGTDSTLLRLNDDPSQGQTFASWTTNSTPNNALVEGIHHPGGSYKRYSEGFTTLEAPLCHNFLPTTRYLYNDWTIGQTDLGSSGSPLFNEAWQIVGQLFGFCSFQGVDPACDNQDDYNNVYGKMSVFIQQISSFLLNVTPDDDFEDNDGSNEARPITPGQYDLRLVDFDDYFSVTVSVASVVAVEASFDSAEMDLNLELLETNGTVLSSSTTAGGLESVSASVSPGTYLIHVAKDAGWGGDYTLSVTSLQKGCDPPAAPLAVAGDVPKNRFLSFVPADDPEIVAYAIMLVSVHDPQPLNLPEHPAPDMSSLEGAVRWIAAPQEITLRSLPAVSGFSAATTCTPVAMDWTPFGEVHVFGPEIVPSSIYEIRAIRAGCDPSMATNYSEPAVVTTARWGDVTAPFQDTSATEVTQPDVQDIVAMVDAVKQVYQSIPRTRSRLRAPSGDFVPPPSVVDVTFVVDAVKGFAFPFSDVADCP